MKLTGKCNEGFEKWLGGKVKESQYWFVTWAKFDLICESAKYGVYVDYFGSVGVYLNSGKNLSNSISDKYNYVIEFNEVITYEEYYLTAQEARTAGIDKANEIRNKQLN